MTKTLKTFRIEDFEKDQLVGRDNKDVKAFALELLAVGTVLYPILVSELRGKPVIIDGTKRILACQWIINNEETEISQNYRTIDALVYEKLSPAERAAYSIISNKQRSDNPIAAYLRIKELKKKKKWKEITRVFKLNPKDFTKLSQLDKLVSQAMFFKKYHENKVALGTMFRVANMDPTRQKVCVAKIKESGKLTGTDIKDILSMEADKVLATLDLDIPKVAPVSSHVYYVYLKDKKLSEVMNWEDALAYKGKGVMYRLVPAAGIRK